MAKQTGLVKYSGTIGGVRHFKIKGLNGDFAGLAGGPTAEQIASDPAFIRTRENNKEFGGCAKAAKAIRVGLSGLMKQMSDPQFTGRLTSIIKQINLRDTTSPRGQRRISISTNQAYLNGLNFNRHVSVANVFNAPFILTNTVDRDGATFTVPAFTPANLINAPAGATHFRLVNAINVISDYRYNPITGEYEPLDPVLNEVSVIKYSGYIPLNADTAPITISTTLPGTPTVGSDVSVMNNIGIEFYQEVGSNYYLFSCGNALLTVNVF